LIFTIGDQSLPAVVTSFRSVDWDRMTPNFYFLFPPKVLDKPAQYNATWMTSLYRSEAQEAALSHVLRQYPSVTTYPVDDLLARVQTIVQRVSLAVEIILLLVLAAGFLVLLTCLRAGIDQKLYESALLRTLGARKNLILGSLIVEFAVIGAIAGLLAAVGAELTAWALQIFLFKMEFVFHPWLWVITPTLSTLLIGLTGTAFCYRVITIPPIIVLRASGQQQ
jgi:putative ABC transport system permease protein